MKSGLYVLCCLNTGIHWLILGSDGAVLSSSPCGFETESDAMIDLQGRL